MKTQEIEVQLDKISLPRWRALQQIGVSVILEQLDTPEEDVYIDWTLRYDKTGDCNTGVADNVNDAVNTMYMDAVQRCFIIEPRKPSHVQAWEESGERQFIEGSDALWELWQKEEWETSLLGHLVRGHLGKVYLGENVPCFRFLCDIEGKGITIVTDYQEFTSVKEIEAITARRWQALQDSAAAGEWPALEIEKEEEGKVLWAAAYSSEGAGSGGCAASHREAVDMLYFSAAIRGFLTAVPWRDLASEYPDEPIFRERAIEAFAKEESYEDPEADLLLARQELADFAGDVDWPSTGNNDLETDINDLF